MNTSHISQPQCPADDWTEADGKTTSLLHHDFVLPLGITLQQGWSPGLIGWVAAQHGHYYSKHWNLGAPFEALVAQGLGEWMLRSRIETDCLLSLQTETGPIASLTLDGSHATVDQDGVRIRFVIIEENWQSQGLGGILMALAMRFIAQKRFPKAFLTTFKGLEPARKLYERFDFQLSEEKLDSHWGMPLYEQKYVWVSP